MKQVIHQPSLVSSILLEAIDPYQANIGILLANGEKAVLIPSTYESELFFARCLTGWAVGNHYAPSGEHMKTIGDWMTFFVNTYKGTAYVFDTPQELFSWLGK